MSTSNLESTPTKCKDDILLVDKITYIYERTWRDIIFLPYSDIVGVLFIFLLIITIHIDLYILCFDPIIEGTTNTFYIISSLEMVYAAHTALLLAHKVMKTHRKRRHYHPCSWILLFLDCISILPLQYGQTFVQYFQWKPIYSEQFIMYTSYLKLLRLFRLLYKYEEYKKNTRLDNKILITVFHFVFSTIIAHIMVICYYSLCCLECHNDNITRYFSYISFDDRLEYNWFIILYTYAHLVILHNYWGLLSSASYLEHILAIACLAIGFFLRYIFMMGNMITYYIRDLRYMFCYKQEHVWTNQLMHLLQFDQDLIDKINEYYKIIWKEYKGINRTPEIFKMFPPSLQREVLTDIYWDALMHSHMFDDQSRAIRREATSIMSTEIRMPGETIFKTGALKYKLVYIVSGEVQLMATENVGAPIMSFSSGTILGAISCILPTISNGTFVCSTSCHLHVLNYKKMHTLYQNKRSVRKDMMKEINDRIKKAKIKQFYTKLHQEGGAYTSHISWIKTQWRKIAFVEGRWKENVEDNTGYLYNEAFSSRFLDLLVLSGKYVWHENTICLRNKCPLILKEDSNFQKFLYSINLIVIALQFLITAKCIAFDRKIPERLMPVLLILDLFYFLDLYVQLITAPTGFSSKKPTDIILYRARQMIFIFDVIATVPYDYFSGAFMLSEQITACLRAPRFLKLYKLVVYFRQLEIYVNINSLYFTMFAKFMVLHGSFIMIFVCISYITNCYNGRCDTSWLEWSRNLNELVTGITYETDDYADTFHHLISIYLGLKISNKMEVNIVELIISTLIATIGFYVSTYCFVELTSLVSLLHEFKHQFLLNMDILNEITDRKDLVHLKSQIINYAGVQWNLNKNQTLCNIYTIMGQESEYLRKIVTREYVMKAFSNTTLFQNANPRYLRQLADNSKLLVIPNGHLIFDPAYKNYFLYLIVEGNCLYRSLLPCDLAKNIEEVMTKYSCFPVVSVFEESAPFIRVTSLTTVILLAIPYLVIKQLLRAFPTEEKIMKKTCALHQAENKTIFRELFLDEKDDNNDILKQKVDTFTYSTEQRCSGKSFYYGLTKVDKFFRTLVLKTYDPNSKAYFAYEVFRSICIVTQVVITLLTVISTFYQCFIGPCKTVLALFWFLGLLDIYIRGHVQYYNHLGIKVTKLSRCFKHYVETSFTTDFISTLPYQLLGIVGLFYANPMRAYLVLIIVMRSIALYRPVQLFIYCKNSVNPRYQLYFVAVGAVFIVMYFFATTTHIYLIFTCDTTHNAFIVHKKSWINMYTSLEYMKEKNLYLIIYYVVSSMTITYTYARFSYYEIILQLLIVLYIFIIKMFFMTYVLGCKSHGNILTAKHQDAIRDYLGFISNKLISNTDKHEMIDHISNYWKKSNGTGARKIFENFSPYMKEEIFLSLYKHALTYCCFFYDAEESLYRLMAVNLNELHYKKGADIVRTNDVQEYVYIVANGHVNVYIADLYLCTLNVGGIFGCFQPRGITRQTIRVTASVHVKIIYLKTYCLYEIAGIYQVVYSRLKNAYVERREFLKEFSLDNLGVYDEIVATSSSFTQAKLYMKKMTWFYRTVYEGNVFIKVWKYVTNVHVASISSTYCLYVLVVDKDIYDLWLWIVLDIYFLCQIYIRCHTAYTDLETGVNVTQFEEIAMSYLKSFQFYVDAISIIPVYLFAYLIDINRTSMYLCNKFVRVSNLYIYYYSYVVRKNIPRHLQWTFLAYNTLFLLQVVFDIWYTVADYDEDIKTAKCYLRVFSVYTSTGLLEREFKTEIQLVVNLILIYVTQALLIHMLIVITRLLIDYNYTVCIFKISLESLMTHFKNELLSKPLAEKIFTYLVYLYRYHNGRQDPILFQTAPSYIVQDHKSALYRRFIEAHFPFSHAHIDFMRQLYEFVDVGIYLPGDIIVEVGDCNSTMYFIEYGEVIGIEEVNGTLSCKVIKEGVFGKLQGLLNIEHKKTYKALTVSSVISVCKHKWKYLLDFFPATKEVIDEQISRGDLAESDTEENESKLMAFCSESATRGSSTSTYTPR